MRHRVFNYAIFVALAVECLVLATATDSFLTTANITNVIRQNAFTAILAAGMTFVILIAGIDLSVGSVVGLSGVLCADALARGGGVATSLGDRRPDRRRRWLLQRRRHHDDAAFRRSS